MHPCFFTDMALYRKLFESPNLTREEWNTVRLLRKRVLFWGWFQSVSAVLGILPVYVAILGYGLESPVAGYLFVLFMAMFLLPGCILGIFIFRLKTILGKGLDMLVAVHGGIYSIAPGWGIIIALLEAEAAQTDIDLYETRDTDCHGTPAVGIHMLLDPGKIDKQE